MKANPILEEIWRIKDEMASETGHDVHRLCQSTRQWAAEHPHPGPVVRNAEELRRLSAETDREHRQTAELTLKEGPSAPAS